MNLQGGTDFVVAEADFAHIPQDEDVVVRRSDWKTVEDSPYLLRAFG